MRRPASNFKWGHDHGSRIQQSRYQLIMPITINGDGSITGISVGGLPDGIVDADMIAADAVTPAKVSFKGFTSYAIICDQKTQDTDGGTFTKDAWQTRDLNTEIADPDSIVSISNNQFTLNAGSYLITANCPCFDVARNQARLYNATTSTSVQVGTSTYNDTAGNGASAAILSARVTITGDTIFEIQHRCSATKPSNGFGVAADVGAEEIYTTVEIFKEA